MRVRLEAPATGVAADTPMECSLDNREIQDGSLKRESKEQQQPQAQAPGKKQPKRDSKCEVS